MKVKLRTNMTKYPWHFQRSIKWKDNSTTIYLQWEYLDPWPWSATMTECSSLCSDLLLHYKQLLKYSFCCDKYTVQLDLISIAVENYRPASLLPSVKISWKSCVQSTLLFSLTEWPPCCLLLNLFGWQEQTPDHLFSFSGNCLLPLTL